MTSIITGYFFSIGADLWQVTKAQQISPLPISPFWYVSVPLGFIGLALLLLATFRQQKDPKSELGLPPPIYVYLQAQNLLDLPKVGFLSC